MLGKKLARWQEAKLITAAQAKQIAAFEDERGGSWVGWGFAGLGVFSIICGIIALVAANWYTISDTVKLSACFTGFAVLIGAFMWVYENVTRHQRLTQELILAALMGYTLASIGLIGQIFQVTGEPYQTALFWAALTAPLILFSRYLMVGMAWVGALVFAACWLLTQHFPDGPILMGYAYALPSALLLAGFSWRSLQPESSAASAAQFYGRVGFIIGWFLTGLIGQVELKPLHMDLTLPFIMLGLVCVAVASNRSFSQAEKALLAVGAALFALLLFLTNLHVGSMVIHSVAILNVVVLAAYAAIGQNRAFFNVIILLTVLRLIIVYAELLGTLLYTGTWMIITGVLLLAMVYLWYNYSARVQQRLQAWLA